MTYAILADIGGTNIRLATMLPDGTFNKRETWLANLYDGLDDTLEAYRDTAGLSTPPHTIAVCAAGPLVNGRITLTNGFCGRIKTHGTAKNRPNVSQMLPIVCTPMRTVASSFEKYDMTKRETR